MPGQFLPLPRPTFTFREFAFQMYRLINASNPTVPLHGDDQELALHVTNQLLLSYASTGNLITIANTVEAPINIGIREVWFTDPDFPTDAFYNEVVTITMGSPSFTVADGTIYRTGDKVFGNGIPFLTTILSIVGNTITMTADATVSGSEDLVFSRYIGLPWVTYIKRGRLANLNSAWLLLDGVTYPLIDKSRDDYLAAWKYDPLKGLPRFIITFPQDDVVIARLYPAPSQFFNLVARAKFELPILTKDSDMNILPQYYIRFLLLAGARDVALYKGRADAWTDKLEARYDEAYDVMVSASEVNTAIAGDEQSLLNGAWRVRAGI